MTLITCGLSSFSFLANAKHAVFCANIEVKPAISPAEVKSKIEAALKRNAELDAERIIVDTADGKVTLKGNVRSWTERMDAENAAWAAPGVRQVDDRLLVTPALA